MTKHGATSRLTSRRSVIRGGFTLIELLVVIAVIAIVGSIVLASFRGIAKEARLSSGTNTVVAALGHARAMAMKNNRLVMVVFRPRLLDEDTQVIEIVTAQWTRQSLVEKPILNDPSTWGPVIDRFEPIQDAPVRRLSRGIKVAGPMYADSTVTTNVNGIDVGDRDSFWTTQAQLDEIDQASWLSAASEPAGRLLGVMFSPQGNVVDANPQSDARAAFIDFDGDTDQLVGNVAFNFGTLVPDHYLDNDEPVVTLLPFLSIFDDDEFRELFKADIWLTDVAQYEVDLRQYLTQNANRIHFNSYTGVALR